MAAFVSVFSSNPDTAFGIILITLTMLIAMLARIAITATGIPLTVTRGEKGGKTIKRTNTRHLVLVYSILSVVILTACVAPAPASDADAPADNDHYTNVNDYPVGNDSSIESAYPDAPGSNLTVHYMDIGQGDSTLIVLPEGQTILIDAGKNSDGNFIVNYIKGLAITKIDYLIATHPDADHTGGLDTVINLLDIGQVYMPDITSNTRTFEDVLAAIENKGLSIHMAESSKTLVESENLKVVFLAPVAKIKDTNDMSAVLHITYGNTAFLFTGDAEYKSEKKMLESGFNVKADVLKAGHHGSKSSSSKEFVKAVSPQYVIISCGADNPYGHPATETLAVFREIGAEILRTDEMGTIIAVSDGVNITFNNHAAAIQGKSVQIQPESSPLAEPQGVTVFVTKTGSSYHMEGCRYLSKSQIPISLEEAASQYTPCSTCNPPR